MRFRVHLLTAAFVLASIATIDAVAQTRFRAGPPENVRLQTKDGVGLSVTYYPSSAGQEAAPVVMLHDHKGTQGMFAALARRLQTPGADDKHPSFAVVTLDLRGHGSSVKQTLPTGQLHEIDAAKLGRQDIVNMGADLEAVRRFLVGKNDAGELNLNKLALLGVGMGATVAVNWAAADWVAPPLSIGKQGQDVKALVLVSPRWKYRGILLQQALRVQPLRQNAAWMLIYGDQDREATADALRLYRQLERFHDEPKAVGALGSLVSVPLPSALEGSQLLSQAGPQVENQIVDFLRVHAAEQDYPWIQRRNRVPSQ